MRRLARPLLAALAVFALAGAAWSAVTYSVYRNTRYGYSVEVPAFLAPQPEAENGDGRRFVSEDGGVEMAAWGEQNVFNRSLKEEYEERLRELEKTGIVPPYRVFRTTWFVLSWRAGDALLYERTAASREARAADAPPAQFATVTLRYQAAQEKSMAPVVTRVSRSLRGPAGR